MRNSKNGVTVRLIRLMQGFGGNQETGWKHLPGRHCRQTITGVQRNRIMKSSVKFLKVGVVIFIFMLTQQFLTRVTRAFEFAKETRPIIGLLFAFCARV